MSTLKVRIPKEWNVKDQSWTGFGPTSPETRTALNKLTEHIKEHKRLMDKYPENGCNMVDTCDTFPKAFFRSTVRLGNLTVTFMEDGKIGLKRESNICTVNLEEISQITRLGYELRDRKTEHKNQTRKYLNDRIEDDQEQLKSIDGTES